MHSGIMITLTLDEFKAIISQSIKEELQKAHHLEPARNQGKPWTIQQAAAYIELAVSTVYNLVAKNEIPVAKKGKRLYFSKDELDIWINSGRKKTLSELEEEADAFLESKRK